ncbi:MAG: hypothetical protein RJA70_896 [Pseudomonadota bacterium]|jgi:HEAT repeat protein
MNGRYPNRDEIRRWIQQESNEGARVAAVRSLIKYAASSDVRVAVIQVLQEDSSSTVRIAAAQCLGEFKSSDRCRIALTEALEDERQSVTVRAAVAKALAKHLGGLLVDSALRRAAQSSHPPIQQSARQALAELQSEELSLPATHIRTKP